MLYVSGVVLMRQADRVTTEIVKLNNNAFQNVASQMSAEATVPSNEVYHQCRCMRASKF